MYILGMFGPGENPSAALLKDGKLIALVEEEKGEITKRVASPKENANNKTYTK